MQLVYKLGLAILSGAVIAAAAAEVCQFYLNDNPLCPWLSLQHRIKILRASSNRATEHLKSVNGTAARRVIAIKTGLKLLGR